MKWLRIVSVGVGVALLACAAYVVYVGFEVQAALNTPAGAPVLRPGEQNHFSVGPYPDEGDAIYVVREDVIYRGQLTTPSNKRIRIAISDTHDNVLLDDTFNVFGGDVFGEIDWQSSESFTVRTKYGYTTGPHPRGSASDILPTVRYRFDQAHKRFQRS